MTRRLFLWLPMSLGLLAAQTRPLTILHSNDLHAHLLNDDTAGGFARLATVVRREKANCEACLYLNAGDLVQGTPVSTLFHGVPVYGIANLLGFDASTLGNHEFDYGWRRVQEFVKVARFPVLSANIVDAQGASISGQPYLIANAGGMRIGIIGVVMGDLVTGGLVLPSSVEPWKVLPVVETVRKYAGELRDRTDLIVVLGHIHDREEVMAILQQVPEVSVVVAGHSHAGYSKMMEVNGRVAVLVHAYGTQLGRLDLQVDVAHKKLAGAHWKKIPIGSEITPARDVAQEVGKWEGRVSKLVDVPIGESVKALDSGEVRQLVEQAMAEETGSNLAFINSGGTRDTLPKGRILARAIWNILPFDDHIVIGKFKGSQLPKAVTDGRTIDPNREYTLAVTDYVAANQAAKAQLGFTGMQFPQEGPVQRDAVIDWIRNRKVVPATGVREPEHVLIQK